MTRPAASNANRNDLPRDPRATELRTLAKRWYAIAAVLTLSFAIVGLFVLLIEGARSRRSSPRSWCKNNLKQIGLALHNYHDTYGCFPPAYVADGNGRPMHSWRVLILPFIDQTPLYNKYRFDEPWDGPNNRQLADMIVPVYNCPSDERGGDKHDDKHASTMASYLAIVGPEAAWPGSLAMTLSDFEDGTSNTLLVVEVANSGIHWMEPRDLHVLQMAPTINAKAGQGISSRHKAGAHALAADGSVRFFPDNLTADQIRAWLTSAGGDESGDF